MVEFVKHVLGFILNQIATAEQQTAPSRGFTLEEDRAVLLSLRTVDDSLNQARKFLALSMPRAMARVV